MPPSLSTPLNLAIFASGAGSNAQVLIDYFKNTALARVRLIVCNKPGAGVLQIAEREGITALLIEREPFFRGDGYIPVLEEAGIHLVVLAGFLWKVPQPLIDRFPRRIINIHPALLPKYGGKGMYGAFVHEAVLRAGDAETGITIHYVDEQYDHGDVIFQARCAVAPGANAAAVSRAVQQLEHYHYPRVIESIVKELTFGN
jgi:phosphoribosylglycinamide formyltransferase-1